MRPHLTAFEHQLLRIDDADSEGNLTSVEADSLSRLSEQRPGFFERGHRSVRLKQYCGLVTLGDRMLEILPKVEEDAPADKCQQILLNLLSEAKAVPALRHSSADHHLSSRPLLEVFVSAFFDEVRAVIAGGLIRQYQECAEDLSLVRGRILPARQFATHANRPDRIACQFDELTADNVWNQFVKAALRAVRRWITSTDLHRRWVELIAVFDDVSDLPMAADALKRLSFHRQARRYRDVTGWAEWILALLAPSTRAGSSSAPGLLFDMNKLFERAVANALRRQWERTPGRLLETQDGGIYLGTVAGSGNGAFALRPDIVLRELGRVSALLDTKWKSLERHAGRKLDVVASDAYQMNAYATAYGCPNVTLVYPLNPQLREQAGIAYELATTGPEKPRLTVSLVDVRTIPLDVAHLGLGEARPSA